MVELPKKLDKKAKSKLEAYCKSIKKAEIQVEQGKDYRGMPTIKVSFESYDKRNKGFMEVINIHG